MSIFLDLCEFFKIEGPLLSNLKILRELFNFYQRGTFQGQGALSRSDPLKFFQDQEKINKPPTKNPTTPLQKTKIIQPLPLPTPTLYYSVTFLKKEIYL